MKEWLKEAEDVCSFSDPPDWLPKKEVDQSSGENDFYFLDQSPLALPSGQLAPGKTLTGKLLSGKAPNNNTFCLYSKMMFLVLSQVYY